MYLPFRIISRRAFSVRSFELRPESLLVTVLVSGVFIICAETARADAYSWQDGAGHIFFGENPPANAKNVTKLNPKRYSKYSSEKMLAPYKQYVNKPKVSGDLPADGHDPAIEPGDGQVAAKTEKQAEKIAKGVGPQKDRASGKLRENSVTESSIDLPPQDQNQNESQVSDDSARAGLSGSQPPKLDPKTDDPDGLTRSDDQFPVLLEQGDLAIKHNKKREVTECSVTVFNHGTEEAQGVAVSFQFADGTVIPGAGPSSISANGQAEYRIPKSNLPVIVKSVPIDADSTGPIPMVLIQSAA